MLKLDDEPAFVRYVGGSFSANNIKYDIISVAAIRDSVRLRGRKVYQLTLRSELGRIETIEWE